MVTGILLGMLLATIIISASAAFWLKKQQYEQQMIEMGKKHEIEKIIMDDRVRDLQQQLDSAKAELDNAKADDADGLYRNSQGFYTTKKVRAKDGEE